jgi:hypothetical protein
MVQEPGLMSGCRHLGFPDSSNCGNLTHLLLPLGPFCASGYGPEEVEKVALPSFGRANGERIELVGGMYDLSSGRIRFFEE